jgi:hypothetical protein
MYVRMFVCARVFWYVCADVCMWAPVPVSVRARKPMLRTSILLLSTTMPCVTGSKHHARHAPHNVNAVLGSCLCHATQEFVGQIRIRQNLCHGPRSSERSVLIRHRMVSSFAHKCFIQVVDLDRVHKLCMRVHVRVERVRAVCEWAVWYVCMHAYTHTYSRVTRQREREIRERDPHASVSGNHVCARVCEWGGGGGGGG